MEKQWFKDKMRLAGVTTADLAAAIGRDRAVVSRIINGHQTLTPDQAEKFAEALEIPLQDVVEHAGLFSKTSAPIVTPGFAEGDVAPFTHSNDARDNAEIAVAKSLGMQAGTDIWTVATSSLSIMGYSLGDYILVNTKASEMAKPGDVVLVQVYDWQTGSASTLLRRYEPPVVVAASVDPEDQRVHVVDNKNVYIAGVVTASWRVTTRRQPI